MHRQTPTRSTWRTRMKSSSSYSSRGTYGPGTPALLCAASSLPKTAAASSTAAVTARRSVTSATNTTARWPAAFTVAAVSSRPSASMSISATEAPAAANAMALALPIPEAAPVISAARPDMSAGMCPPQAVPISLSPQGPGSSTIVVLKGRAQDSTGAMQQDSLVLGRDVQGSADFFGGHPADVAHSYHAALARRQRRYGPVEQAQDLLGEHHAVRACVPPGRGVDGRPPPGVLASGDADPVICGPSSGASDQGSVLASRAPRVLARLTRIENVHVRSEDLPSNFARPLSIPSQASWTTSSADCGLPTKDLATRSMVGDH